MKKLISAILVMILVLFGAGILPSTYTCLGHQSKIGAVDPAGGRDRVWVNIEDDDASNCIGRYIEINDIIDPHSGEILISGVCVIGKVIRENKVVIMADEIRITESIEEEVVKVIAGNTELPLAGRGYSVSRNPNFPNLRFKTEFVYLSLP